MTNKSVPKSKKPLPPVNPRGSKKGPAPAYHNSPLSWIVVVILLTALFMLLRKLPNDNIGWNDFTKYFEKGQVESIEISDTSIKGKFNQAGSEPGDKDQPTPFTASKNPNVEVSS